MATLHSIYLLDTNILSDMMRNPDGTAFQRFQQVAKSMPNVRLCTSVIVQCELLFGLRRRTNPRWHAYYGKILESVELLPLDSNVVPSYAKLRTQLEAAGTPIGPNDTLIAAQALSINATLVSADVEFLRVPGLRVENWLADEDVKAT